MSSKDALGSRMKSYYESRAQSYLIRRMPVIIRVDGKSFTNFCKRFTFPYDIFLHNTLNNVMLYLCKNIQGAKFAERHSDEISIVLTDYDNITTDAFFNYESQKICSVVASMATAEFCRLLALDSFKSDFRETKLIFDESWPCFDCRCFNIPKEDVENYFYWRMLDAKRNSISMHARSKFSHKSLIGKSCDEMQEMLFQEHGINWGNLPQSRKIGFYCKREEVEFTVPSGPYEGETIMRSQWILNESPHLKLDLDALLDKSMP